MKPLTQEAALRRHCSRILSAQRRRARVKGKTLSYSLESLMERVLEARACAYCRMPLGMDFQMDHRKPIARGGTHELSNQSVVCSRCNSLKGKLTTTEYLALRELLASWHPAASEDLTRRILAGSKVYASSRRKKT